MAPQSTEIELIKQAMTFQNKEIAEIKKILLDFIDSAESKFSTKEEHRKNEDKIRIIEEQHGRVVMSLLGVFGSLLIGIFILIMKKIGVI